MTPESVAALLAEFLRARQLDQPTSQPLYSYRAKLSELDPLEAALCEELLYASTRGRCPPSTAQGFCLWAAEWWRRNHTGGHWRWEDMLAVLRRPELGPGGHRYGMLCQMVVVGLKLWKRDVLRTGHGRAFLVTLACEGGLPLKLVQKEGASLRVYFRALLEETRVFGRAGVPFSTLAERVQDRLPRTLRNQVVYELCGSLAAEIWRLQGIVGEALDPVVELDRHHSGWRERLPLLVSDEVAKALLRNLLTDAAEVVNMGGRLRWERFLEQAGDAWALKGRLELPASLGLTEVEGLFGLEAANRLHHAYFDVLVQPENSAPTLVAMASPRHDPLSGDYFSLEHARPVSSDEGRASGARSLLLRHRDYERASEDFRGASPMSDLPWVFLESSANDAPQSLKFVGEGTVSVREPRAFVALTEAWTLSEPGIPTCSEVGVVKDMDRILYKVRTETTFQGPDDTSVVVTPNHQGRTDVSEYRPRGRSQRIGRREDRIFLGAPDIVAWRATGPLIAVPTEQLRWRANAPGASWVPYGPNAIGTGTVRLVRDGQVRCSLRLRVAPQGLSIRFEPASSPGAGALSIHGLEGGDVHIPDPGSVDVTQRVTDDSVTIHMATEEETPESVTVLLDWGRRGRLTLELPYPSLTGAYLAPGGERLPDSSTIPKGATSGVRAMALVPDPHAEFFIWCDYRGTDQSLVQGWRPFIRAPMRRVAGGLHTLDLGSLHRQLSSVLGLSTDLHAYLRILIQTNDISGFPRRELRVGHYAKHLEYKGIPEEEWVPWAGQALVGLSDESGASTSAMWDEELTVEAISLQDPAAEPVPLTRVAPWTWAMPSDRLENDWLVTGRTGSLHRCGPVIVKMNDNPKPEDPEELAPEALSDQDVMVTDGHRLSAAELAEDPVHPGWNRVDGYAGWGPDIPAAAFPLLKAIAKHRRAAAVGLMRHTSEEGFRQFWSAMESLPFWWRGLHLKYWHDALGVTVARLKADAEVLAEGGFDLDIPGELQRILTPIMDQLPHLRVPFDSYVTELLGGGPTPPLLKLADSRKQEQVLRERQEGTRGGDGALADLDSLPDLHFVSECAGLLPTHGTWRQLWVEEGMSRHGTKRFDVLNAPVLSAVSTVLGPKLSDSQIFRLRSLRDLAPDWFDELHRTTFLFALGVSLGEPHEE